MNKTKDRRVISDRDEPSLDYFRRHRIFIGGVLSAGLTKVIDAKETLPRFSVSYASQNDDPEKASTFGASPDIAPPSAAVARLLNEYKPDGKDRFSLTLILRRDDKRTGLYHVVGCTGHTPVRFFDNGKENATDGFRQKNLCFTGDPKK